LLSIGRQIVADRSLLSPIAILLFQRIIEVLDLVQRVAYSLFAFTRSVDDARASPLPNPSLSILNRIQLVDRVPYRAFRGPLTELFCLAAETDQPFESRLNECVYGVVVSERDVPYASSDRPNRH
jgi:hypothetical protein